MEVKIDLLGWQLSDCLVIVVIRWYWQNRYQLNIVELHYILRHTRTGFDERIL